VVESLLVDEHLQQPDFVRGHEPPSFCRAAPTGDGRRCFPSTGRAYGDS
jgi:hypothetical protein